MRPLTTLVLAVTLGLSITRYATAGDVGEYPLYSTTIVQTFFTNEKDVAELKLTPEQRKQLKQLDAKKEKITSRFGVEIAKVNDAEPPRREWNARLRELQTQESEELFKLYAEVLKPAQLKRMKQLVFQAKGMGVFDHPEVQKLLKPSDKQMEQMREAYAKYAEKAYAELKEKMEAKQLTPLQAGNLAANITQGVPDPVRALLTPEQSKVFDDLHGPKFIYSK